MPQNTDRQPAGIPAGGQFAATTHAEPQVTLPTGSTSAEDLIRGRDAVRERREQAQEETEAALDRLSQRLSIRGVAATILAKYPDAATLRISENPDGENQFDTISITTSDGTVLEHSDEDGGDWMFHEMVPQGPSIQEFVWDLDPKDDSWADGVGKIAGGGKWDFKSADIDLHAALNAPLPADPDA